jgi:hypothetical protein
LKNIEPLDSNLMKIAKIGINQESIPIIITEEKSISKILLIILFAVSSKGMFLNEKIGI